MSDQTTPQSPAPVPDSKDIQYILGHLPHRYPFLLIDRVLELEPGKRVVTLKNVTVNEPHFTGHFPDYPVMPGVLIVEAMAQSGGILALSSTPEAERAGKLVFFAAIDHCRFRKPVVPGDQLRIEVTLEWNRGGIGKVKARATVDGQLACEATLTSAMVDRK